MGELSAYDCTWRRRRHCNRHAKLAGILLVLNDISGIRTDSAMAETTVESSDPSVEVLAASNTALRAAEGMNRVAELLAARDSCPTCPLSEVVEALQK